MPALRSIRPKMKIHKSVMCEVSGKKKLLTCEGKVAREARRKGFYGHLRQAGKKRLGSAFYHPQGVGG